MATLKMVMVPMAVLVAVLVVWLLQGLVSPISSVGVFEVVQHCIVIPGKFHFERVRPWIDIFL